MLSGHAVTLHERRGSRVHLAVEDAALEAGDEEAADAEAAARVLYRASFRELMPSYLQDDTIIWALISLLLVLAWGIGLLLLLYLPYRRYVLKRDILSRQLYLTENSCPQSVYSLYTFRIESIAHGKPAPVDELQFHGVHNPDILKKVIIRGASRRIQEVQSWKSRMYSGEGPSNVLPISGFRSPSPKVKASSRQATLYPEGRILDSFLLHKLEEVIQPVKNLESLLIGSHPRE